MPHSILKTRLYRPKITSDIITRRNLIKKLEDNTDRPLTLVSAPTGYGKSTLVSSWLESAKLKSAWISLDTDINEFKLFLQYFFEAINSLFSKPPLNAKKVLNMRDLPDSQKIAESVLNGLNSIEESFILVLDDFHHIQNSSINSFVQNLIQYPAPLMHLIIISRKDPNLPIFELRAKNRLNELRSRDLQFTLKETEEFFKCVYNELPESGLINKIDKQLEGWPAALRLLVSTYHSGFEHSNQLESLDTNHIFAINGLIKDFLKTQSEEGQAFLLRSSILDKFCPPLCDRVCYNLDYDDEKSMSKNYLNWLESSSLFTIQLDDRKYWHRYHHMFRDALQMQFKASYDDEMISGLHNRAADWYAENKMLIEAIKHYLIGQKTDKAVRLFLKNRVKLQNGQNWSTLEKVLNEFPAKVIDNNVHFAFSQAWLLIYQGKTIEMFDRLPHLESLLDNQKMQPGELDNLTGELMVLKAWYSYNVNLDFHKVHDQTHNALDKLSKENIYALGLSWVFFAGCHQALGRSRNILNRLVTQFNDPSAKTLRPYIWMGIHYIYWLDGDLFNLVKSAEKSLAHAKEENDLEGQANAGYFLTTALYMQNRLDESQKVAERTYELRYHTIGIHHISISYILGLNFIAASNFKAAAKVIDEMEEYATNKGNPYFMLIKETLVAELDWYTGNKAREKKWANENGEIPLYPLTNVFSPHLSKIKLLIYQEQKDRYNQAGHILEELEEYIVPMNNQRYLIDVFAWQAVLCFEQGEEQRAIKKLKKSLQIAESGGFIRNFIDMGPKIANILNYYSKRETDVRYVGQLLAAFKEKDLEVKKCSTLTDQIGSTKKEVMRPGIELTERESEILSLISKHLQNKEIGEKLFISTETVKKHTYRIYQKLNVANRRLAVEKAEALGLI